MNSKNHFTVQVKRNTSKLHAHLNKLTNHTNPLDSHCFSEQKNGIKTTWQCDCYAYDKALAGWNAIETVVKVSKTVLTPKSQISTFRFYVSSAKLEEAQFSAHAFNLGIRKHWDIENKAHKNKDVIFKQDKNRVKQPNHAVNRAILNTIVINLMTKYYKQTINHTQPNFILFSFSKYPNYE